ncbi:MAG TPA: thioredoxin domain-containing protein [Candidatus Sulfopaludibacter sp.]|jgi:protein-disulfide isomerase|nr:thioredoxin domain-containing protein [Candidatus Sulfopaludibacter sp.]
MANDDSNDGFNDSRWVDERLARLDAGPDWNPDPVRAMAILREKKRMARRHRIEWTIASVAGAAACILLVILQSPGACAMPRGCPAEVVRPSGAPLPAVASFKQVGSTTAPIVCEVYTDYECPSCALLYKETIPLMMEQYVKTGKVRLIHRDFPLARHQYARAAARWANAAGAIGRYDVVVGQIFRTQAVWKLDGNLEPQIAQVLTPDEMQKVRATVGSAAYVDNTVDGDLASAGADHVSQTPTLVIVAGGQRRPIQGVPQFATLKAYLDGLLAH